ncbi:putative WD repeat-containing protein 64 [Apostichopus japonicus]|uniref:Putative WD repeat-containing protein 64 n=1 Tax=Stichopus japonicus TaxID=307972 RepID=A0A2G8LJG0_STIJA|nr:putative WD repeat-containing protein 64 [Apostichopus japonicus]
MKGDLLQEISAMTRRHGTPVTAACADEDCNTIITGDQKGYITIWGVSDFLQNTDSEEQGVIEQVVSWRAHLSKIVSLVFINHMKVIVSGSVDGSVRVWYAGESQCGHFMGFFNQHRSWNYPSVERSSTPLLPYDITERPLRQAKHVNDRKTKQKSFDYPLIFTDTKWKPFRRSAYIDHPVRKADPVDKKFFNALEKPHFYNDHLQSCGYPERIKTPQMNTTLPPSNSYLYAPLPKTTRSTSPIREVMKENQHLRKRGSKSQLNISLPVSGLSDQKGDFATHGSI